VNEIRLYVEGGGSKDGKAAMRRGMGKFLSPVRELAREQRVRWQVIACGSREDTFSSFQTARGAHPEALSLLLVDAERGVSGKPRAHLRKHDGWGLGDVDGDCCHLMVQVMEAWLIADPQTLAGFFGQGFRENELPGGEDVERVRKSDLMKGLERATRNTGKGRYHKMRHGPAVLGRLDPQKVRNRARHCNRLFQTLEMQITGRS